MNPDAKKPSDTLITKDRTVIEKEVKLAKDYWLETIQPHLNYRMFSDVGYYVARHARWLLDEAVKEAQGWNQKRGHSDSNAPLNVDLPWDKFGMPEVPTTFYANELEPEYLAEIAAQLVRNQGPAQSPDEAIKTAHELVMLAELYIKDRPYNPINGKELQINFPNDGRMNFTRISFAEIQNRNQGGGLLLLPPLLCKVKQKTPGELNSLKLTAIKEAVRLFLGRQKRSEESINDCVNNQWISLADLCSMRWERFKTERLKQQDRARTREARKARSKTENPKQPAARLQLFRSTV